MNKLPVFRTIGQTFGFVVERRFFSLLRLIWFPALLSVVIGIMPLMYQSAVYGFPPDPGRMDEMNADGIINALSIANFVMSLILSAMIAISVHRMILLDDVQKGVYFYWRLTREEWLYIAAWFGYFIVVAFLAALPWIAHVYWLSSHGQSFVMPPAGLGGGADNKAAFAAAIAGLKDAFNDPRTIIVACMSVLLALIGLARFGLVFPIIVAEGRLSFARSWAVTRGNFLRLVGFWILTTILAYVLILVTALILGVAVGGMVAAVMMGGKEIGALGILVLAVPAAVSILVYLVVGITLFIAAMSFSYKTIVGEATEHQAEAFA